MIMNGLFKAKVRKVGTSLGVLIPKKIIEESEIKEGEEVAVVILLEAEREKLIKKAFGMTKGAGPFIREKEDRIL